MEEKNDIEMADLTEKCSSIKVFEKKEFPKDSYTKYKELQKQLQLLDIQENFIKEEIQNLKIQYGRAKEEIKVIQGTPLLIGQFTEMIDENYGLVQSSSGSNFCVRILSTISREELKINASVAMHKTSHAIVKVLEPETDSSVQMTKITEKPDVTYQDIGGLDGNYNFYFL